MGVFDEDALAAAVDLIARTGARDSEFGFANENARTVEDADWYATASYRGAKVMTEHHRGPVEAAEALARRLMEGGTCTNCGRIITLTKRKGKTCRWTRTGARWERGCG